MQSSDTVRLRKARTYYISKINEFALQNPGGDCLTAQCTKFSNCKIKFDTYELYQLFIEGKNSYWDCAKRNSGCSCGR